MVLSLFFTTIVLLLSLPLFIHPIHVFVVLFYHSRGYRKMDTIGLFMNMPNNSNSWRVACNCGYKVGPVQQRLHTEKLHYVCLWACHTCSFPTFWVEQHHRQMECYRVFGESGGMDEDLGEEEEGW